MRRLLVLGIFLKFVQTSRLMSSSRLVQCDKQSEINYLKINNTGQELVRSDIDDSPRKKTRATQERLRVESRSSWKKICSTFVGCSVDGSKRNKETHFFAFLFIVPSTKDTEKNFTRYFSKTSGLIFFEIKREKSR